MDAIQITSALDEVLDFLVSSPTPQQIIEFHASDELQARVRYLLEKNQAVLLTVEENKELEQISQMNHLMRMLKIKARDKLAAK